MPHVFVKERHVQRGEHGVSRCKLPPWIRQEENRKGEEKEEPLRFHTTWLTRLLGQERRDAERSSHAAHVRRGSRKSGTRVSRLWSINALGSNVTVARGAIYTYACASVRACVFVILIKSRCAFVIARNFKR